MTSVLTASKSPTNLVIGVKSSDKEIQQVGKILIIYSVIMCIYDHTLLLSGDFGNSS